MSLLLAALLIANPTEAAPAAGEAPPAIADAKKEERKICRREAMAVGLHRTKRICLTAAEWKAREGKGNVDGMSEAGTRGN
jgi:hypothetical protein